MWLLGYCVLKCASVLETPEDEGAQSIYHKGRKVFTMSLILFSHSHTLSTCKMYQHPLPHRRKWTCGYVSNQKPHYCWTWHSEPVWSGSQAQDLPRKTMMACKSRKQKMQTFEVLQVWFSGLLIQADSNGSRQDTGCLFFWQRPWHQADILLSFQKH